MAEKFYSERDLNFHLYEVNDVASLTGYPLFADHSRETFDMVIETAKNIAIDHMRPFFTEMDRQPPQYINGGIRVHPSVRNYMKICGEGGWINAPFPYEMGGQQIPLSINNAAQFIFSAANYSLSVYPHLTTGAAHLIMSFGTQELKDRYVPKMFAGQWQGTMALTEPEAGSSLSDVVTSAEPMDKGYYRITGQKTFISAGDCDSADNIIHLMLARVKGAPAGVKGLSLFVVPKFRIADKGGLEPNDVACAGCYHKMGYRGSPIAQLSMGENGDCRGWLLGSENKGLAYMFQMMNEARVGVGIGAVAIATAAYHASLEYAKERLQGRNVLEKDPTRPQMAIIEHADVRRMLLNQKVISEGGLALAIYCGKLVDLVHVSSGEEKERSELLLEILTPVVKTYPSEMGIISTSLGVQCLGGYGYCDDFPLEQHMRDMRIHPIHEGTTGIQAMDLLGRKATMKNGKALMAFAAEVESAVNRASSLDRTRDRAAELKESRELLKGVSMHLMGIAMKGNIDRFLSDATLYLEFFGYVAIAWQWLLQGMVAAGALAKKPAAQDADFYEGKLHAMDFFFEYELPKCLGLAKRLRSEKTVTLDVKREHF